MSLNVCELTQGSAEWLKARAGSLGASQVHMALARTKSGWGASRANIRAQLVAERLTGQPTEGFESAEMRWGKEQEPQARKLYSSIQGVEVSEVGIVRHPSIQHTHASPDGLVGRSGLIEIKCPNTATHIDTLLTGTIDGKYVTQMQWQMVCTGREWCDFVSYDPRLPGDLQMFVKRVSINPGSLETDVHEFLLEVGDMVMQLNRLRAA